MAVKRAGIAPIGSNDTKIEMSFDAQRTWQELAGVIDFDRSSGSVATYEGTPLRQEAFLRTGSISAGAMSIRTFNTSWHPTFDKLIDAHANKSLFYVRFSVPREELAALVAPSGVAISDTGIATFTPAAFPIDDQPYGIGAVLEVGNDNYICDTIEIDPQTKAVTTTLYPIPPNDIPLTDCNIVLPGVRSGAMGANCIDWNEPHGGDGGATMAFNLRLQGQPAKLVIDRTIT